MILFYTGMRVLNHIIFHPFVVLTRLCLWTSERIGYKFVSSVETISRGVSEWGEGVGRSCRGE